VHLIVFIPFRHHLTSIAVSFSPIPSLYSTITIDLKDSDDGVCCTEFTEFFLGFFHNPVLQKTRRFGNWICFRLQVKVGETTPTQLGPLERANLNHWKRRVFLEFRTMEKVQKNFMNSVQKLRCSD
jgi:hypothetical protein